MQQSHATNGMERVQLDAAALVGPGEGDTVMLINRSRNQKTNVWLQDPTTKRKLALCALVLVLTMDLMALCFLASAMREQPGLLAFIAADGPPVQLIDKLFDILSDLDNAHWVLLREPEGWTEEKLDEVQFAGTTLLGQTYMRLVHRWKLWPWPPRILADRSAPAAARQAVLREKNNSKQTISRTRATRCVCKAFHGL